MVIPTRLDFATILPILTSQAILIVFMALLHVWIALTFLKLPSAFAEPPVLRVSLPTEPTSFDWKHARSRLWSGFVMRGLTRIESGGKVVCDLCSSFEWDSKGTLKVSWSPKIKWTDGQSLKSRDFSIPFKETAVRVEFPDAHTLVLKPSGSPLTDLARLLSQPAYFPVRQDAWDLTLGPYMLAEWNRGQRMVLEANPHWFAPELRPVYRLEFYFGTPEFLLDLFERGKLDILSHPTTPLLMSLKPEIARRVQQSLRWSLRSLIFHTGKGHPGNSKNFREAFFSMLSRDSLLSVLKNGDRSAGGIVPPGLQGHRDSPWKLSPRAWPCSQKVKVLAQEQPDDRAIGRWIDTQVSLQEPTCNFKVKFEFLPATEFESKLSKGRFDVLLDTHDFVDGTALGYLRRFKTGSVENVFGFSHVGYTSRFTSALRAPHEFSTNSEEILLMDQILEQHEWVVLPLSYPSSHFLVGPRVIGFAITPLGEPDFSKIQLQGASPRP